ncbi:MAG: bifunctional phosphopantothenoylcysteine decarboxylase/phosphopantothenate--cysteine ligase CoaBC [Desulfovibrio sp.]|jgi:phosphopantothenoylcysteine decarboxylase/phosphopantothenate--cysteine ligase|nr:bifunctional phosphopantothenoylcysteine decarboxylase/phosphopantothenate--cysteine ligase CoaBC [Desulfovibrio sp.]
MRARITAFDESTRFRNQRLHMGVCGSVACCRSPGILRALLRLGLHVGVTLTQAARQFVTPTLFTSLGAIPVDTDMFAPDGDVFAHLGPGERAQAMAVVPATADCLSRLAHGGAGDMLSAQVLAFAGPLLVAPAMNPRMWANPAVQQNVRILVDRGVVVVGPGGGEAACGETGTGVLADDGEILLGILRCLSPKDMAGRRVMVTLGPTRERWDAMRYWTNPSTGLMGACLATAAWLRGADVTAVCGTEQERLLPVDIHRCPVASARDMFDAAMDLWSGMDIGMFVAAVADFSPERATDAKVKKVDFPEGFSLRFTPNPDILATLSSDRRPGQQVLAFAAETAEDEEELLRLAREKLLRKGADVLAANSVTVPGSGFGGTTNGMCVVDATGREAVWPVQSKADAAWELCTWLLSAAIH